MVRQFRFARVRFAAVSVIAGTMLAGGMLAISTVAACAFSQQVVTPNGNYNFDYGPLNDKAKLNDSAKTSDPNSPGLHFSIRGAETDQFGPHDFLDDNSHAGPPDASRLLGNGD